MVRLLAAVEYLASALLVVSLTLLLLGLGMAARPEFFATLGLPSTSKIGLEIALASGICAMASALVGRIAGLLDHGAENGG